MKQVLPGQSIPYGFSMDVSAVWPTRKCLLVPLFVMYRRGYLVSMDEMRRGWWTFNVLLKKEPNQLVIAWGFQLIGRK